MFGNVTSYFLISSKNLKWKQYFHSDRFRNYQLLNIAAWSGLISRRGEVEARGIDEKPLSDKPPLIWRGETYSAKQ